MASTYAVGREQPFLEANLRLYREHIVGLEHAYWQKHINPLVMWAVYMIHIEPPERGSLRMRAVYEARQINRDGTGSGKIIGPFAYITPLLIELERQSKATCPPSYWTKRAPTTRKAEEQLRVDGFAQSTWFLKKYMQGEAPLTEDMLPTGAVRRGFVPSFTRAQIAAALAGKKQRAKRAPCERSHPAPDEAPARKRAVATAPCSQCGDPVLTESGCPGLAGVIGFRCVHCETVVCPDCTFRAVKETVDRRDAVLDHKVYEVDQGGALGGVDGQRSCGGHDPLTRLEIGGDAKGQYHRLVRRPRGTEGGRQDGAGVTVNVKHNFMAPLGEPLHPGACILTQLGGAHLFSRTPFFSNPPRTAAHNACRAPKHWSIGTWPARSSNMRTCCS